MTDYEFECLLTGAEGNVGALLDLVAQAPTPSLRIKAEGLVNSARKLTTSSVKKKKPSEPGM